MTSNGNGTNGPPNVTSNINGSKSPLDFDLLIIGAGFGGHEELREYFNHVDKVLDLSKDISFSSEVVNAVIDTKIGEWSVTTSDGRTASCTYLICAIGSFFKRHYPDFKNLNSFKCGIHHAAFWPNDLDAKGKWVAIIRSGATGVLKDAMPEERECNWEELWTRGGFNFQIAQYRDYLVD